MIFKRIREFITGRYESKPFVLMSREDAIAFAAEHPCSFCGQSINPGDDYTIINDSSTGTSAHHHTCVGEDK